MAEHGLFPGYRPLPTRAPLLSHRVPGGVLIAALILLAACTAEAPPAAALAQPVRVLAPGAAPLAAVGIASGVVRAGVEVPLAFKTPGIIAELPVHAGSELKAGALVASLVTRELDAQLVQAQENFAKAERDLVRAQSLRSKGMVSQQLAQDAQAQVAVAQAALAAARYNREQAQIRAPRRGVVLEKLADVRETVAAGQPVILLGQLDRGWVVRAGVPVATALRLAIGDAVEITLDGRNDAAPISARIVRISAAADARTGGIEIEAALPALSGRLVSGMIARLRFALDQQTARRADPAPTQTLPLSAIIEGNAGGAVVFVLAPDGQHVRRVAVRTGRLLDGAIEIIDGLPPGASVVSEGAGWLSDGERVRVLD